MTGVLEVHPRIDLPLRRLGNALRDARSTAGLDVDAVAEELGLDADELASWEAGEVLPPTRSINRLSLRYGIDRNALFPPRRPVEYDEDRGVLMIGDVTMTYEPAPADLRPVLEGYIEIVRRMRRLADNDAVVLRLTDLDQLGEALRVDRPELERLLVSLGALVPAGPR